MMDANWANGVVAVARAVLNTRKNYQPSQLYPHQKDITDLTLYIKKELENTELEINKHI